MLRLSTEKVRIYLHPHHIVMVKEAGLFTRKILDKKIFYIENDESSELWVGALAKLREILKLNSWRGLPTTVLLSGYFVKFRVVKWHALLNIEEQSKISQHHFEEIYGGISRSWDISITNTGFKKNEVACGVGRDFLYAIDSILKECKSNLISIEPFLITALNAWRKKIRYPAMFVVVENGMINFIKFSENGWESIRSRDYQNLEEELTQLITREKLFSNNFEDKQAFFFFWPENPRFSPLLNEKSEIQVLHLKSFDGFSNLTDSVFSTAVCKSL